MDRVRRELEKMRAETRSGSFPLKDGSRFYLRPEMVWEFVAHNTECIHADIERRMRPKPHPYYIAVTKAQDRLEALRMHFPDWSPDLTQHPVCPYDTRVMFYEGRLEDLPFAESGEIEGVGYKDFTPIPYQEGAVDDS